MSLLFVSLFLAIQIPSLILTEFVTHTDLKLSARENLVTVKRVFERLVSERFSHLLEAPTSFAHNPALIKALGSNELTVAQGYLNQFIIDANFDEAFIYSDKDGTLAHVAQHVERQLPERFLAGWTSFESPKSNGLQITVAEEQIYVVSTTALQTGSDRLILVVAMKLGDDLTANIAALNDVNLAFLYENQDEKWQLLAEQDLRGSKLIPFVDSGVDFGKVAGAQIRQINHGDNDYIATFLTFPNVSTSPEIAALLYQDTNQALLLHKNLYIEIIVIAVGSILLLTGGSWIASSNIVRPITALSNAAMRVREGIYREIETENSGDEIGDLSETFNSMIRGIQEREAHILHQLTHDPKTDLPNHQHFEKALQDKIDAGAAFYVLNLRIEQLTDIRATIGHRQADELVKQVSQKLASHANDLYHLARLSTVSFGLLVPRNGSFSATLTRLYDEFLRPIEIRNAAIDIHIRIGVASFPDHGQTADELIRLSEIAAIQANEHSMNWALYDAKQDTASVHKLCLMSELQQGLEDGSVSFVYQPKLDLKQDQVTHVEALIRWEHPKHGLIMPDDFIPLAEKTGHIHHLTLWGLGQAIVQAKSWRNKGLDLAIAVNLSAYSFSTLDLVTEVALLLAKHDLPARNLILEVTESAIMKDADRALNVLNKLHDMGISIAIDDYGTGYSSLSYLKRLPADEIKIDKSFVQNINDNEEDKILVRSTIELGHWLGMKVTAEGIENEKSLSLLKQYNCDIAQGYHISRPIPPHQLEQFVTRFTQGNSFRLIQSLPRRP